MQIKGYIWREDTVDKLWWKHHAAVEEVEAVFTNQPRVEKIERGRF